jgi:hypothetical protein
LSNIRYQQFTWSASYNFKWTGSNFINAKIRLNHKKHGIVTIIIVWNHLKSLIMVYKENVKNVNQGKNQFLRSK